MRNQSAVAASRFDALRAAPGLHDEGSFHLALPSFEPYSTGRLCVSPVHELYFEESGNPPVSRWYFCTAVLAAAPIPSSAASSTRENTASSLRPARLRQEHALRIS